MVDQNTIEFAKNLALEAGKIILEAAEKPFEIEVNNHSDFTTSIDKLVESYMISKINKKYPNHCIISEELTDNKDVIYSETVWIIDPIDGTANFIQQKINYAVSLAVYHRGEGFIGIVYDPTRNEMFMGIKGEGAYLNNRRLALNKSIELKDAYICIYWNKRVAQWVNELELFVRASRLIGCASLELSYVAAGRLDICAYYKLFPWDYAAAKIIMEEAGGKITNELGEPIKLFEQNHVIAGSKLLQEDLIQYIKQGVSNSMQV
ncbi:inositol monophosphatase family protein [Brevibacillus brevis]|uniref:inositol monophosphatase family protein n=1 Tax=Brevibacillus brevis TaxID=1393 RepID=UPI00115971A8|nr:inositol monophosphatase [Lysinibacillus sp. SDF0063]TQR35778.1 inositol monophosphatase [Lysinibacillus sp. SDF0063]